MGVMYMLKLRHDGFGLYAGTCWRMLFVYALVPWMRKYRNGEDNFGVTDFKFPSNRMWTGRMPTQSAGIGESNAHFRECDVSKVKSSIESENSISVLRQENKMLKKENEMMRSLLYQRESVKTNISHSCPPRIVSESSHADFLTSANRGGTL